MNPWNHITRLAKRQRAALEPQAWRGADCCRFSKERPLPSSAQASDRTAPSGGPKTGAEEVSWSKLLQLSAWLGLAAIDSIPAQSGAHSFLAGRSQEVKMKLLPARLSNSLRLLMTPSK